MESSGSFVWVDLSTYNVGHAMKFYESCFGWQYKRQTSIGANDYVYSYANQEEVAGIYLLPQVFRRKRFPSFWMTYIQVHDLDLVIDKALTFEGAKIEVGPTIIGPQGRISLIRDPLGAGFTIYEGSGTSAFEIGLNRPNSSTLHISNLAAVQSFYEELFGWAIRPTSEKNVFAIRMESDRLIGTIEVLSDDIRGDYEYWIPVFTVKKLNEYLLKIRQLGGELQYYLRDEIAMVRDDQHASFLVKEWR